MYFVFKRIFDVFVSLIGLILVAPIMLLITIVIKQDSIGPIFYRGKRASLSDGIFFIYKFRTMEANAEKSGGFSTALDDPRITKVGRFLRKYKLDELPQLFNVLIGDMSLVGPRPQVTFYTDQYQGEDKLILSVKPGITDLASIYFVDMDKTLGTEDVDHKYQTEIEPIKNQLRLKYAKEQSFILDVRILIETIFKIIGIQNVTGLNITVK